MSFFKDLVTDYGSIVVDDLQPPSDKVPKGAKVIGTLDDEGKKLFSLLRSLVAKMQELGVSLLAVASRGTDLPEVREGIRRYGMLSHQFNALLEDLKASIVTSYPQVMGETVMLCEGWKVVTIVPSECPLADKLSGLKITKPDLGGATQSIGAWSPFASRQGAGTKAN